MDQVEVKSITGLYTFFKVIYTFYHLLIYNFTLTDAPTAFLKE